MNSIDRRRRPILTLEDIPPQGEPATDQPRIYFGEREDVPFIVVNTATDELDFAGESGEEARFSYDGSGGSSSAAGFGRPCSPGGSATSTS